MKRYIYFIGMILCLSISHISAIESESPQDIIQTIHQENIIDDTVMADIDLLENHFQQITIINDTSYDLQLTHLLFYIDTKQNNESLKIQLNDIDITDYVCQQEETTNQKLQDYIHQLIIPSHQQVIMTISIDSEDIDSKTVLQSHIQMKWEPIYLQGYIYKDINQSASYDEGDEGFSQMKVNLWQNHNLIQTTKTNEEGYYQFLSYDMSSPTYLEVECPKGYTVIKNQDEHSFTLQNQNQLVTTPLIHQSKSETYSIGLIDKQYKVSYYSNEGKLLLEEEYHYLDQVKIKNQTSFQTDEQYIGWSNQKNEQDIIYHFDDEITMPCFDIKLYAIQKQTLPLQPKETSSVTSTQVQTSDDTEVTVYLLLVLLCGGYLIIIKSLKKK